MRFDHAGSTGASLGIQTCSWYIMIHWRPDVARIFHNLPSEGALVFSKRQWMDNEVPTSKQSWQPALASLWISLNWILNEGQQKSKIVEDRWRWSQDIFMNSRTVQASSKDMLLRAKTTAITPTPGLSTFFALSPSHSTGLRCDNGIHFTVELLHNDGKLTCTAWSPCSTFFLKIGEELKLLDFLVWFWMDCWFSGLNPSEKY